MILIFLYHQKKHSEVCLASQDVNCFTQLQLDTKIQNNINQTTKPFYKKKKDYTTQDLPPLALCNIQRRS